MRLLIAILACWTLSTGQWSFHLLAQQTEAGELVDAWLDSRGAETPIGTQDLLESLSALGIQDPRELEDLLRAPRAQYSDTSAWRGKITTHDVACWHVDYQSKYLLFVPEHLDGQRPLALVVIGHGGNSSMSDERAEATARAYLQAYQSLARDWNTLLVAPVSTRGWGHIGNSLIVSTISKLKRSLPIDPDRIYITGQSMGGHLAFRAALSLPDYWGAVSPHSGGYDYVSKQAIGNLLSVPGYAVWGTREPYGINGDNRTNAAWGARHGLDWKFVEKPGGHEIYQDELAAVAKFFQDHPRDLYRPQVYLRSGGAMKFLKTWQIEGWPNHTVYSESRPMRWNVRHWLQVEPRPDLGQPLTVLAKNQGQNRIKVTANNVRQLSLFLHPRMIDMDQPLFVTVNDQLVFQDRVQANPLWMLDLVREFDDRGRVFWCKLDLPIETDQEIVIRESE